MSGISPKKVLLVTVTILFLAGTVMGSILFHANVALAKDEEIGPNQVQGKVTQFYTRARKGTIVVKSDKTGKTYTFYIGWKTVWTPRYPSIGETIKVYYVNDRGFLKATRVDIVPSS